MKIQEFAKKLGLTESAIRYYEKIGLIPEKSIRRSPNGYREFSDLALENVEEILRLKSAGLDLDQIRSITVDGDYDCESLRQDIEEKIKLAELLILDQQRRISTLRSLLEKCHMECDMVAHTPCCK